MLCRPVIGDGKLVVTPRHSERSRPPLLDQLRELRRELGPVDYHRTLANEGRFQSDFVHLINRSVSG